MDETYVLKIDPKVFDRMLSGKCKYVALVNNRKIQRYVIGNYLTFICDDKEQSKQIKVSVKNLLYFDTIKDLLEMVGKEKCGYTSGTSLDKIEDIYYATHSNDKIEKFGLVALEFSIENN